MFACCIKHEEVVTRKKKIGKVREIWLGKLDFFMSVMGFNIGLGNLLRFPYLCMKNGGGAFLVPYFLFLCIIGIPMFMMEMSLAQYSGLTPIEFYGNISPLFKGIGWCNVIACSIYNLYYNVLVAWIIFYFIVSFKSPLPWSTCDNYWNTINCKIAPKNGSHSVNMVCDQFNISTFSPTEEFWEHYALKLSSGIGNLEGINVYVALCLLLTWSFVFLCLIRGIKSMGRVVYVTAVAPYFFMIILLIRGLLLEGSKEGVKYYLYPRMSILSKPTVWLEAGQQIFWSLAPGWGITISLASHNPFFHNIYRDSIMLPIVSCMTSFLGGLVIFSFVGYIAFRYSVHINCVFKVGPGLAFNVYPETLQLLPLPQLWCVLFFLLLFALGLDSSFTSFETVYDSIKEEFSSIITYPMALKVTLIICSFLISLPLVTRGGFYLFLLIDYYQIALFPLLALIEVLLLSYIYGTVRIKKNILKMTNYKMSIAWDMVWKVLLPLVLVFLFGFTIATQDWLTYGNYVYPTAAVVCGWLISLFGIIPIFVYFIYKIIIIYMEEKTLTFEILKSYLQPTLKWSLEEKATEAMSLAVFEEIEM